MSAGARTERIFCNGASANSGITTPIFGARFHGPVFYLGPTPEENAPIQVGTRQAVSSARSTASPNLAPTRQRTSLFVRSGVRRH
jgi:hypothetical protein